MGKIIAVTNQKGGVGKTTTSINLAAALSKAGKRIMLIDMDPQGNATVGSGVDPEQIKSTIYEVLIEQVALQDTIISVDAGYDVVPADGNLAGVQVELMDEIGREMRLQKALAKHAANYDYIFIDCPPALNVLTINALTAAHTVMIPMQCEYFALEGLSALVNTIRKIRETLNPKLSIEGLLRTMFDGRNSLANEVSRQLCEHFGKKVYDTVIPRNVRLAEAPSYGLSAIDYDTQSPGAKAYLDLAAEMIKRDS